MTTEAPFTRRKLVRDAVVFQFKLFVDGLRDLLLSPVSIIMAIIDVFTGGDRFYRLLALGRQSEEWINLFETHQHAGLDTAVSQIEEVVRNEYREGKISASARDAIRRAMAAARGEPQVKGGSDD